MQNGRQVRVRAGSGVPATDPFFSVNGGLFSATAAQNAGLNGRIQLPEAIAAGRVAQCRIRGIEIVSLDNLIWEVWFWANSKFQIGGATGPGEAFLGSYVFAAAGTRIGGAGLYYASANGENLDIFYEDDEAGIVPAPVFGAMQPSQPPGAFLNVTIINRSAGAKTAGGWFDLTFICEPTQGQ